MAPARLSYPHPSSAAATAVMKANRRTDTGPERALRSALHQQGHRFRKDAPVRATGALVRPDIVFTRRRLAVFVDGCFWHRCPEHGTSPRSNAEYWRTKLDANVARDRRNDHALQGDGWTVLRVWEHEPPVEAAARVTSALAALGQRG